MTDTCASAFKTATVQTFDTCSYTKSVLNFSVSLLFVCLFSDIVISLMVLDCLNLVKAFVWVQITEEWPTSSAVESLKTVLVTKGNIQWWRWSWFWTVSGIVSRFPTFETFATRFRPWWWWRYKLSWFFLWWSISCSSFWIF